MKTEPNHLITDTYDGYFNSGLTKREYFAALAMQGMLANTNGAITENGVNSLNPVTIARAAVNQADYLIDYLNQHP